MTLLTITPTTLTPGGGSPTSLTTLLAAGGLSSNTGVVFQNTGHEIIIIQTTSATTVVTSDIGTTVQGQPVTGLPSGTLAEPDIYVFGPYPSQYEEQNGTFDIELDFSVQTGVNVVILRIPGVI
jgi:hypothetical protein